MDHKSWLWRKKSSEKTITVSENVNHTSKGSEEETYVVDKALDQSVRDLNEKLSTALTECNGKDELVTKHAKVAEEAIAGWEKAEAEAESFKKELDDALRQRVAAEERIVHLDAALKECMQQLRFVREEQEQRIHDAVMKTSKEFNKSRIDLEGKLSETSARISNLVFDNSHLSELLRVKEKLIEDLSERKGQVEADFNALMERLDTTQKDNASLKYEVRILGKELEIRNEEREFNRRSDDASQKQHMESVKKIVKLENECQRLRLLVRKRLPGPAALAKMKSEVETLGRDATDMRRKKMNPTMGGLMVKDNLVENFQETSTKRINFLIERLCGMEEENKILKETLAKKNNELEYSRITCERTSSKLSQVEAQFRELSKGQSSLELASISKDGGNGDDVSCSESWASALILELEHFRNGNQKGSSCKSLGVSDLSLMDDFVEMEKLAIVSLDSPFGRSHSSTDENNRCMVPMESDSRVYPSEATGKELVLVKDSHLGFSESNQEIISKGQSIEKFHSWLQDILRVILEQCHATQRSHDDILEEVRIALMSMNHPGCDEFVDVSKISSDSSISKPPYISGYISWKSPITSPTVDSSDRTCGMNTSLSEISNQNLCSNLNKSISKIIELIEGINQPSLTDYNNEKFLVDKDASSTLHKNSETLTGYTVRVFQWKKTELGGVVQHFVHICNDVLQGKVDLEKFAVEVTSTLDWIMNHCFSLQDVSSMKDTIKKHLGWDESHSESEHEVGVNSPRSETEKIYSPEEYRRTNEASSYPPATSNGQNVLAQKEKKEVLRLTEENMRLKDEIMNMEFGKKVLEEKLRSTTNKKETLLIQLQETEQCIASLQVELALLKDANGLIEGQIENHKLLNEDLDIQLSVSRVELSEARQKVLSLEVELEDKNNCCEELEAACLELQLQLESAASKEISNYSIDHEEKQLRADWEISAATEKLAECQETILNLGKQLKALASPRDAALLDKMIAPPEPTPAFPPAQTNHRTSLLDQMLAEDDGKVEEEFKSPKTKEIICTGNPEKTDNSNAGLLYGRKLSINHKTNDPATRSFRASPMKSPRRFYGLNETKHRGEPGAGSLAIVPKRQGGGGLLRKLLMRKKREGSRRTR
ncbi:filament-like protein (DUF869) [Tasmannia lanceolata]|uniref:filament-like protein (DUF869) n=1 Tax=Tasmannia lanceolata TaxID=3420 RepID=UPI0040640B3D